jgi:predicted TIM-barrel fold metal-dependent hydrolase
MSERAHGQVAHLKVRPEWLEQHQEDVIDPDLPIIDPHHHLWDRAGWPYSLDNLLDDIYTGHNVVSTVFVECRTRYRAGGPSELRPVGEIEFVRSVAEEALSRSGGRVRICEGVIAHADLRYGNAARSAIEVMREASGGRLRGVRHSTAWDPEPEIFNPELGTRPGLLAETEFRDGVALLGRLGLTFDAWLYHPQLDELAGLARACSQTQVILDHAGGPIGIGRYRSRKQAGFREWQAALKRVAECHNVSVKLGGLAMRISGQDFHERDRPPSSEELAAEWRALIETCIEAFGPERCMFESNFPVDKASCSYRVLWNAFKRLTRQYSSAEKWAMFAGTAARLYRLEAPIRHSAPAG